MAQQGVMTGKPLIESDRVEGTTVYDPQGNDIGSIKRLMIEKISGRVAYAVMSFGGFLGMGEDEHAVPWASSPMTPISAAIAQTSPNSSYAARRPSHAKETGTGATALGSGSCTTTTVAVLLGRVTPSARHEIHLDFDRHGRAASSWRRRPSRPRASA
jgi:hypothetical protein